MKHEFEKHENCEKICCPICDGDLLICKVCGGAESSLPTHCPGGAIHSTILNSIQEGIIDFKNNQWSINEKVTEKEK